MEVFGLSRVCHGNQPFEEVNDTRSFQCSKSNGFTEWELAKRYKSSHSLKKSVTREGKISFL